MSDGAAWNEKTKMKISKATFAVSFQDNGERCILHPVPLKRPTMMGY